MFEKKDLHKQRENENLKEFIEAMEMRYQKSLEKKNEEIELLVTVLYEVRMRYEEAIFREKNVLKENNQINKKINLK